MQLQPNKAQARLTTELEAAKVPVISSWIAAHAARAGLDEPNCFQLKVVTAEALNNIFEHSSGGSDAPVIQLQCETTAACFQVTLIDHGKPLGKLPTGKIPSPDYLRGRGWPIILNWTDHCEYRVTDGLNRLVMRKTLP